jgi:hypothetical protein
VLLLFQDAVPYLALPHYSMLHPHLALLHCSMLQDAVPYLALPHCSMLEEASIYWALPLPLFSYESNRIAERIEMSVWLTVSLVDQLEVGPQASTNF